MATITSITCSRQVRVNTGNYEGTEALVSMTAAIDEFDSPEEETESLQAQVDAAMMLQLRAIYASRAKKMSPQAIAKLHGIPLKD